jgi:photoactive yellow protein
MTAVAPKPLAGQYVPSEVIEHAGSMTRIDADGHDFGVVKVDDAGKILMYNKYESEMGGYAASAVEGKNFFTDIALCTNNALFFGQFKKGVAAGTLNMLFPYMFTYKMKPTNVKVHMYRDADSKTNWVFVKKS